MPKSIGTYAEPFSGGAAVFFALASEPKRRYKRAILADKNLDLVACYEAVRDSVEELIEALGEYRYDEALFYEVRDKDPATLGTVERGARLIFLNRTCYNGLWRVNSKGRFNVPFGRYTAPRIVDPEGLRAASKCLQGVEVRHADYADVTRGLVGGDFVYFDPPYAPVSKTASFSAYAREGFGPAEQARLADELRRLRDAGVPALLSNADTAETNALYKDFEVHRVRVPRSINSNPKSRGEVWEVLVQNRAPSRKRERRRA